MLVRSDRGGNEIEVAYEENETNLHSIWDGTIISDGSIDVNSCLEFFKAYSLQQINDIRKGDILSWMKQSRWYLPQVYNFQNNEITAVYVNSNAITVKRQLIDAALRLNQILQALFM